MIDLYNIVDLLEQAKLTLNYPKLQLTTPQGHAVVLKLAGDKSKWPGSVTITDDRSYPGNTWYGRIGEDGTYHEGFANSFDTGDVVAFLEDLNADTVGVIAAHGLQSGSCCMCNRELTDERSTHVGYGPVCAKSWGLPWGLKDETEIVLPETHSTLAELAAGFAFQHSPEGIGGEVDVGDLLESIDDDPTLEPLIGPEPAVFTRPAIGSPVGIDHSTDIPADWSHRFIN